MTLGGRVRGSRPAPTAILRRKVSRIEACVTESYDGADASVYGYDQPWSFSDSSGTAVGAPSGGIARVRGDQLSLAGSASGTIKRAYLRCDTDAPSVDMRVSATISAVALSGFTTQRWGVFARMFEMPGDPSDFAAGDFIGWHFQVALDTGDWYVALEECYYDSAFTFFTGVGAAATYQSAGFNLGDTYGPFAEGDEIALTLSGSGSGLSLICEAGGATLLDVDAAELAAMNTYPGPPPDTTDYYARWSSTENSTGRRGGVELGASSSSTWSSGVDDDVRLDNFSVCPA